MLSVINFQYLFDFFPPVIQEKTFLFLIIFSLFLVILAFLGKFLLKKGKLLKSKDKYQVKLVNQLVDLFFTAGLVSLLLIYLRKFRVPYLQMRFVLIVWGAFIIIWLITIVQNYLTKVPELREQDQKRREYEKYLK